MGITINTLDSLIYFKKEKDIDFSEFAMIGRQQFYFTYEQYFSFASKYEFLKKFEFDNNSIGYELFSDHFFKTVFNSNCVSFDANGYEGANYIHDFNFSINDQFVDKYTTVFDGGSTEHIFDVPMVLNNYKKMLKVGGTYVAALPCNQWGGHGFYQFNPELFYRFFSSENGFNCSCYLYHEQGSSDLQFFEDAIKTGRRIEFMSDRPLSLFVIARKLSNNENCNGSIQQSYYDKLRWS